MEAHASGELYLYSKTPNDVLLASTTYDGNSAVKLSARGTSLTVMINGQPWITLTDAASGSGICSSL